MIKIICKRCGYELPMISNKKGESTIMNSTYTKEGHYPSIICPECAKTLVIGKKKS